MARGMTLQRDGELRERMVYLADAGQHRRDETAANKGRGLKIGKGHDLAQYLEKKIGKEKWSPDAAVGAIKAQGLEFSVSICTKTVYNMIERGDFLTLTNKDLPIKRDGKKRSYKRVRKVALNNTKGRSIEERPPEIESRDMKGLETSCLRSQTKRTTCYYAHPYSAYERGSNENANKLIRRFIPKGSNFDKLSTTDIKRIETWMNNYPRRIFGYRTANHMAA
jgi:IS30 family transposase